MASTSLPGELVKAVESQSAVLFLGAAASYGAKHPNNDKIPNSDRLRDTLCDRFLAGKLKEKPLATVAEYSINESSFVAVQQFIRDLLLPFQPADFHLLLPQFRWHGVVTTNYDLIVERAYETVNPLPLQTLVPFVKNGQPVETLMKRTVNGVQFLKLHGSIDFYQDSEIPFVLANEQYARYSKNRTRLVERFKDWGHEFPIIFCGYSISDPHIQNILFELDDQKRARQMYYIVDPAITDVDERYWASRRITSVRATFEGFLRQLHSEVPATSQLIPRVIGGGTSSLRSHYKVANAPETPELFFFLSNDVDHVRPAMPVDAARPRDFYRGVDDGWGAIESNLDVPRGVTDSLVVDAILSDEQERSATVDFFVVKGPAGNGKTIVLKRAAWMAAHDYEKIVLFVKAGGTIRLNAIEEIHRYTEGRIFLFIDKAAHYVDEIHRLMEFARAKKIKLTVVTAERDAEWNVRCESLDKYVTRDFQVRYLSEKEIRNLLGKLEEHDSLGLLREISNFEDRVQRLVNAAQRQLLVVLHEATLGKAFEDIVYEEYQRIIPPDAQTLYLDICTLHRFGVTVRAGLINRVSGIDFADFESRLFKPLQHIVRTHKDKYIGDWVYSARHQHVAEMVFERVLVAPEQKYDQIIRIMTEMNLDYSSDREAFSQLVRGRWVSDALRSRELGRTFFDAALRVAPREAFLLQQRAIFEMQEGGDLQLAETYLDQASELELHNKSIQHSRALLARRQALATSNPLLRLRLRDRARGYLSPLLGSSAEHSYGYHSAAQLALDDLRDLLEASDVSKMDNSTERRIVECAKEFERYMDEGLQKFPLNEHLLALEAEYRRMLDQSGAAETALRKAFTANPRLDWIAVRLARTLESAGKGDAGKQVLLQCVQDNPGSKQTHFELAKFYMRYGTTQERQLVIEHLRRSFTSGDRNYEAQFWYAREAYLSHKVIEAMEIFGQLREADVPAKVRNEVRGVIMDDAGHAKIFIGDVVTHEDVFVFVRSPEFSANVFVHRSRAAESDWDKLARGQRVQFTVGFNMRGPTGASVQLRD